MPSNIAVVNRFCMNSKTVRNIKPFVKIKLFPLIGDPSKAWPRAAQVEMLSSLLDLTGGQIVTLATVCMSVGQTWEGMFLIRA